MDYEILIGKTVKINGKDLTIAKIKKETDIGGRTNYVINGKQSVNKFDLGLVVYEFHASNEKKSLFNRIFGRFGFTVRCEKIGTSLIFSSAYGLRHFGYKFCAFFCRYQILRLVLHFEFSWRDKDEYIKGRLPEEFGNFKRVF